MIIDNGVIAGNIYNKYESKNFLIRQISANFLKCANTLISSRKKEIETITEVGCGEGHLATRLAKANGYRIRACDISPLIIKHARQKYGTQPVSFYTRSIYDLTQEDSADLVICCEVLEHLFDPDQALRRLAQITKKYCLVSVPHEPWWRLINAARGKYLLQFGNTPGHCQHWGLNSLTRLVTTHLDITEIRAPFPWIMLLTRKKTPGKIDAS